MCSDITSISANPTSLRVLMIPSTSIPLKVKLADWTPILTPLMVEWIAPRHRASGIPASAILPKSLLE
jgi:hypothetical protein